MWIILILGLLFTIMLFVFCSIRLSMLEDEILDKKIKKQDFK